MPGVRSTDVTHVEVTYRKSFGWVNWAVLGLYLIAMLLMGMGYKGEEFATRMHLKHDAANRVRNQVLGTAPERISDFDQIDTQNFSANKVGDTEYYRAEAQKALETLLKMYF